MTAVVDVPAKAQRALTRDEIRAALRPARRSSIGVVDTSTFQGTDAEFQEYCASLGELDRWRREDLSRISRAIAEHKQEMGREGLYLRLFALYEQLEDAKEDVFWRRRSYAENAEASRPYREREVLASLIHEDEDRIERLRREIDSIQVALFHPQRTSAGDRISPIMIERAREYPLENLIEIKRGISRCVSGSHSDKNPSMDTRNNFAYCYACGWSGDAIAVAMKVWGTDFTESVRRMQ